MQAPEGRKKLGHTSANVLVHFIFSTRQRTSLIHPDIEPDLHSYLGGIVREMGGAALAINGCSDHIHMLVRVPPVHSIAEVARVVKANSSRWVHERWPQHRRFGWQTGYGAFSVSESNVVAVTKYVAGQHEHHKKTSFQEEFVAFLKKNGIAYDEPYIWD
jgi:REP element-mobilizing transposase RayT